MPRKKIEWVTGSPPRSTLNVTCKSSATGLVVSARDVIFAHARPDMNAGLNASQWQTAVDRGCRDMIDRLAADTPAGVLRK